MIPPPHSIIGTPAASTSAISITVRDFLTNRHAFTLPSTHPILTSYPATLLHTSRSLFRHPKAFTVHFHASVQDEGCGNVLEGKAWEEGRYWGFGSAAGGKKGRRKGKGGNITVWAHFVRVEGVDVYGYGRDRDRDRDGQSALLNTKAKKRKRKHEKASSSASQRRKLKTLERHTTANPSPKHTPKINNSHPWQAYSLPPPNTSPWNYFSTWTEIVPRSNDEDEGEKDRERGALRPHPPAQQNLEPSTEIGISAPFPGFFVSHDSTTTSYTRVDISPPQQRRHRRSTSPLFEPLVEVKREISPGVFVDEGDAEGSLGFEWWDSC